MLAHRTPRNGELRCGVDAVIVMLSNNTGVKVGYLAGRFPGRVGQLYSPGGQRGPEEFLPFALDNGAFSHDHDWSETAWLKLMAWAKLSGQSPLWALVPDVVGDKIRTLRRWAMYAPLAKEFGWPLAFAVQDGMVAADVPPDASIIFIGGSTEWKWSTLPMWCRNFSRVHVGRVNTYRRLWQCHEAGAESTDGTGFMRGDQLQYRGLRAYLEESSGARSRSIQLELIA